MKHNQFLKAFRIYETVGKKHGVRAFSCVYLFTYFHVYLLVAEQEYIRVNPILSVVGYDQNGKTTKAAHERQKKTDLLP